MRNSLKLLVILLLSASLQGCYILKQGKGQLSIWNNQIPIEDAIQKEPDPIIKSLLAEVKGIKRFAVEEMFLDESESYSEYYTTPHKGIAFVVTASPKDVLEPYQWWFPVIGAVPYKGFFDEKDALNLEADLRIKGYDTWLFAAPAYSTLGWFDDPITTPMLRAGRFNLVNTIIHEMTHQKIFVDDQVEFNERLATFVGVNGAFEYFRKTEGYTQEQLEKIRQRRQSIAQINEMVHGVIPVLNELYQSEISRDEKLTKRQIIFDDLTAAILEKFPKAQREQWAFNNARINQYRRYRADAPEIENMWEQSEHDWKKFWGLVEEYASRLKNT